MSEQTTDRRGQLYNLFASGYYGSENKHYTLELRARDPVLQKESRRLITGLIILGATFSKGSNRTDDTGGGNTHINNKHSSVMLWC